jgi:enoyl-CoA hydratase/carnithine racemase
MPTQEVYMSEAIVRRDRDLGNFIPGPSLSEYGVRFESHFTLDRQDGILTIRMHRNGQAARWSRGLLNAWSLLLRDVGADRDNEVVIITGTGNSWLAGAEASSFATNSSAWPSDAGEA